jgi:hypothetical protein
MSTNMARLRAGIVVCLAAVAGIVFLSAAAGQDGDTLIGYTADDLRDPFKSYLATEPLPDAAPLEKPVEAVAPSPSFTIQGIFWGANFPQAIVNDKIVKEGDVINDARILSITRESVKFLFANREFSVSPSSSQPTSSDERRKEAQ